ncbi:MAG: glycosyltransferase family 4 protein [Gemmatimonadales bacterium]
MNIALMVTRAEPVGGAQIHVRDLAAAAKAHGHSPTVITSGSGPFLQDLQAQQIPVVVLKHLGAPISPVRDFRALREIQGALQSLRPDLLATHSSKAGILGRFVAHRLGIPAVFTAHGWSFTPGIARTRAGLYRMIERLAAPLSGKIITVSEFDRRLALEAGIATEDRLATVHNGIPDVAALRRASPGRNPARIVMVARFEPQKDHATLLHALGGLVGQPWELDLIGDGPLRGRMEHLVRTLGLGTRVRFLGQRADVDAYLAEAQISVLTTNWEGFPLTVLEAMRAGLPVVATAVGGVAEALVDGDSGYLIGRGDVTLLRDRLGRLLSSPGLREEMGGKGRTRWEGHFTIEQMVAKTFAIYQDVVQQSRTAGRSSPGIAAGATA